MQTGPKPRSPVARFWEHVDKTESCWVWTAFRLSGRYGTFGVGSETDHSKRKEYTHRFSYELHYGPIPAGMSVLHRCDNPACVRPDHLFLGDQRANLADMDAKGRRRVGRGMRHHLAKLTAEDVTQIRALSPSLSAMDLAARFSVNRGTIYRVLRGQHWSLL